MEDRTYSHFRFGTADWSVTKRPCINPFMEVAMRRFTVVLAVTLVVPLSSLCGQQPPPIEPGARVRISYGCARTWRDNWTRCQKEHGTLVALTSDSVALQPAGQLNSLVVPLTSVKQMKVRLGQHSHPWRGGIVGGLIGGAVTGAVNTGYCMGSECVRKFANGSVAGLVVGASVGAVIGSVIHTDRWDEVPLDRLRVSLAPKQGAFALGMSVAF